MKNNKAVEKPFPACRCSYDPLIRPVDFVGLGYAGPGASGRFGTYSTPSCLRYSPSTALLSEMRDNKLITNKGPGIFAVDAYG